MQIFMRRLYAVEFFIYVFSKIKLDISDFNDIQYFKLLLQQILFNIWKQLCTEIKFCLFLCEHFFLSQTLR